MKKRESLKEMRNAKVPRGTTDEFWLNQDGTTRNQRSHASRKLNRKMRDVANETMDLLFKRPK